mmetsp:Transcript_91545/g.296155  ORF Transcript_91545/g.296155 Transcript_91545/m.296155 type:complete len:327 (+) Transcript_91545:240-1220(+)
MAPVVAAPDLLPPGPAVLPVVVARVAVVGRRCCRWRLRGAAQLLVHATPDLLRHLPRRPPVYQARVAIEMHGGGGGRLASNVLVVAAPLLLVVGPTLLPVRESGLAVVGQAACKSCGAAPAIDPAAIVLLARRPAPLPVRVASLAIVQHRRRGNCHEVARIGRRSLARWCQNRHQHQPHDRTQKAEAATADPRQTTAERRSSDHVEFTLAIADVLVLRLLDVAAPAIAYEGEARLHGRRPTGAVGGGHSGPPDPGGKAARRARGQWHVALLYDSRRQRPWRWHRVVHAWPSIWPSASAPVVGHQAGGAGQARPGRGSPRLAPQATA